MKPQSISITAETFFKVALIALLFWSLYFLRDIVLVLLASVVIASAVKPFADWFVRYRIPRVFSVVIVYVILIGGLLGFLYFFVPPLVIEISNLLSTLPEITDELALSDAANNGFVGELSQNISLNEAVSDIREYLSAFTGGFLQTVSTIFGGVFSFILIVVLSFYLAVQERGIENFLRLVSPLRYENNVVDLWHRTQRKIGRWMQGQLLLGVLIGVLVFLGLTILGVRFAFLLAVLAGIAELIPVFGPIIAAVPAVALGFFDGPTIGLMVLGLYLIIQQFENHLIYPLVVQKVVGISPIVVILSLIIGGKLAGFLGVLLAVPLATGLIELLNDVEREKLAQAKRS